MSTEQYWAVECLDVRCVDRTTVDVDPTSAGDAKCSQRLAGSDSTAERD